VKFFSLLILYKNIMPTGSPLAQTAGKRRVKRKVAKKGKKGAKKAKK
jgi:hypothetical protein